VFLCAFDSMCALCMYIHTLPFMSCLCYASMNITRPMICSQAKHTPTQVIGEHNKAVKAVCWQKDLGCCVSGSWDKTMKVCVCVLCELVRVPAGVGCA